MEPDDFGLAELIILVAILVVIYIAEKSLGWARNQGRKEILDNIKNREGKRWLN